MPKIDIIIDTLKNFDSSSTLITKSLSTLLIILVLWLARSFLLKLVWKYREDVKEQYSWRKTSGYVAAFIGLLAIGRIWLEGFQSITTFLGLISAGIAIALKDIILNYSGWIFIILKQPFKLGDRIQVGGHCGDVIDISLFNFTLMEVATDPKPSQSTGRVLYLPNSMVWNSDIANSNEGFNFIWNEQVVTLTFESNWKKAKEIFTDIVNQDSKDTSEKARKMIRQASRKYLIFYSYLTPIVYTNVEPSGVTLTLRYLCNPKQRRVTEQRIWEAILDVVTENKDIDLAYQTIRVYQPMDNGSGSK